MTFAKTVCPFATAQSLQAERFLRISNWLRTEGVRLQKKPEEQRRRFHEMARFSPVLFMVGKTFLLESRFLKFQQTGLPHRKGPCRTKAERAFLS